MISSSTEFRTVRCRHGRSLGFTLSELLVAVAILAVLGALFFPIAGQVRERSQAIRCLSNLRSSGTLLLTAIAEKGGVFDAWYSGTTGDFWNTALVRDHYLTSKELESLACPGIPYADASGNHSGRHYGLYLFDPSPENLIQTYSQTGALTGRTYRFRLRTQINPAETIFMADSVTSSGSPTIRIFKTDSGSFASGAFHGRHGGLPNVFFFDGHIETPNLQRLYQLGVRKIYRDQPPVPVTLPKPSA